MAYCTNVPPPGRQRVSQGSLSCASHGLSSRTTCPTSNRLGQTDAPSRPWQPAPAQVACCWSSGPTVLGQVSIDPSAGDTPPAPSSSQYSASVQSQFGVTASRHARHALESLSSQIQSRTEQ